MFVPSPPPPPQKNEIASYAYANTCMYACMHID